jgi:hypothetical protein
MAWGQTTNAFHARVIARSVRALANARSARVRMFCAMPLAFLACKTALELAPQTANVTNANQVSTSMQTDFVKHALRNA